MKRKQETLEDVIRMATRVQIRLRKEGIGLHWTLNYLPIEPDVIWNPLYDLKGKKPKPPRRG